MRFCALLPQDEKPVEDQVPTPPGFQLIVLPFADDIRDLDAVMDAANVQKATMDSLTKEERAAARLVIRNLSIDFNSRDFENPSLQKFYSGLQALALNEEEPEPVEDLLEPDYEEMKRF